MRTSESRDATSEGNGAYFEYLLIEWLLESFFAVAFESPYGRAPS